MRPRHRADNVVSVLDVSHPIAHGFVECVFERFGTAFHRHHGGTQELHAIDVLRLTLHVLRAHIDHAFHAVARSDGGGGHTVLACAGFGDHARLTHALGEHGLADHVIDFVRTGVIQILALQIDLCAAEVLRPAFGVIHRAGAAHVVLEFVREFFFEGIVLLILLVRCA